MSPRLNHSDRVLIPTTIKFSSNKRTRWKDAQKNSVSMYARHFFSHKSLQGKTSGEMKELLRGSGRAWEELPVFFREGTYVRREQILIDPSDESFRSIPEKYRPKEPVVRTVVKETSRKVAWELIQPRRDQ